MMRFCVVLLVFLALGCEFFFKSNSGRVHIEIGDNTTNEKTLNVVLNIYAIGDSEPFGTAQVFYFKQGGEVNTLIDKVEFNFANICDNNKIIEIDAVMVRKSWENVAVACDLGMCAPENFDIFSYAERNGFDAYCSEK